MLLNETLARFAAESMRQPVANHDQAAQHSRREVVAVLQERERGLATYGRVGIQHGQRTNACGAPRCLSPAPHRLMSVCATDHWVLTEWDEAMVQPLKTEFHPALIVIPTAKEIARRARSCAPQSRPAWISDNLTYGYD